MCHYAMYDGGPIITIETAAIIIIVAFIVADTRVLTNGYVLRQSQHSLLYVPCIDTFCSGYIVMLVNDHFLVTFERI